ncbi:MAG TPA: CotO family spore coat protein [Bacillota bacterium]|nr:CotO family spore coat protein [Bacillota bacterium]
MDRKDYVHKPLVYIEQPTISDPKPTMQDYFQTDHAEIASHESRPKTYPKRKQQRYIERPYMQQLFTEETVLEDQDDTLENKSFAEESITGKINYLLKRPQFIPTFTCQINTSDGRYYGKITKFTNDIVYLRLNRSRAVKKIPHQTIEDIRLVGF